MCYYIWKNVYVYVNFVYIILVKMSIGKEDKKKRKYLCSLIKKIVGIL